MSKNSFMTKTIILLLLLLVVVSYGGKTLTRCQYFEVSCDNVFYCTTRYEFNFCYRVYTEVADQCLKDSTKIELNECQETHGYNASFYLFFHNRTLDNIYYTGYSDSDCTEELEPTSTIINNECNSKVRWFEVKSSASQLRNWASFFFLKKKEK